MSPFRIRALPVVAAGLMALLVLPLPAAADQPDCVVAGAHGFSSTPKHAERAEGFGYWYAADGGTTKRSTDGASWATDNPSPANAARAFIYGSEGSGGPEGRLWMVGERDVGGGNSRTFWHKDTPAAAWTESSTSLVAVSEADGAYSVSENRFVAILSQTGFPGQRAELWHTDTTTWTEDFQTVSTNNPRVFRATRSEGVDEYAGLYVHDFGSTISATLVRSADAATWAASDLPSTGGEQDFRALAVDDETGRYVLLAQVGSTRAWRTDDLPASPTWTTISGMGSNTWQDLAWGGGVWLAVSETGSSRFAYSDDGATFTTFAAPITDTWRRVAFASDLYQFLVLGDTYAVVCQVDLPPAPVLTSTVQVGCESAVLEWSGGVAPYDLQIRGSGGVYSDVLTDTTDTDYLVDPISGSTLDRYRVRDYLGSISNTVAVSPAQSIAGECGGLFGGNQEAYAELLQIPTDAAPFFVGLVLMLGLAVVAGRALGAMGAAGGLAAGAFAGFGLGLFPVWFLVLVGVVAVVVGGALRGRSA